MTDREMLLHLIGKLGLKRVESSGGLIPDDDAYIERAPTIAIGSGDDGYFGFYAEFHFDPHGNLTSHAILE